MMNSITGFKAFNNMMDRYGNTYELNKEYKVYGSIKFHKNGFHFCKNLEDVFRYYDGFDKNTIVCQVYGYGVLDKYDDIYNDYYDMYASSNIKLIKTLTRDEILNIVLNKGVNSIIRLISGYYLNNEEINIILNKYNNQEVRNFIDYYQKDILNAFEKRKVRK